MRDNWKPIFYGLAASLVVLTLAGGGYWSYSIYQQHRTLWGWASVTQRWVNETDKAVKLMEKRFADFDAQWDRVTTRLDKLESPPQTEAEELESAGGEVK